MNQLSAAQSSKQEPRIQATTLKDEVTNNEQESFDSSREYDSSPKIREIRISVTEEQFRKTFMTLRGPGGQTEEKKSKKESFA